MNETLYERTFRKGAELYLAHAALMELSGRLDESATYLELAQDCENAANALRDGLAQPPTMRDFQPS
jgi:hypothetical protein